VLPDAASRHAVLAETGHGYMGMAIGLAVASAVMAAIACFALGIRRGTGGADAPLAFTSLAWRLVLLQPAGFVLLEVGERLAAGVPAHHMLDPVIVVGTLLQAVAAVIGAAILVVLARGGELVGKAVSGRANFEHAASSFEPPREVVPSVRHLLRPGPIRAPPAHLASLP
jgi:hypothetical protein